MDRNAANFHRLVSDEILYDVIVQEETKSENLLHHGQVQRSGGVLCTGTPLDGNAPSNGRLPFSNPSHYASPVNCNSTILSPTKTCNLDNSEPRMIFFPSCPSREEWSNIVAATKTGISLTGTAARAQVGPVLGLIDIGECDDSYLFQVSLPGVKRDEREFSCEVENDGKVLIRGVVVTGERTVNKHSQVFKMQSQNLCPPGHFSMSFSLPGPVNPHQFSGNFGTDGILEGIVMKVGHK